MAERRIVNPEDAGSKPAPTAHPKQQTEPLAHRLTRRGNPARHEGPRAGSVLSIHRRAA